MELENTAERGRERMTEETAKEKRTEKTLQYLHFIL